MTAAAIGGLVVVAAVAFVLGRWSRRPAAEPTDWRDPVAQSSHWHRSPGLRD